MEKEKFRKTRDSDNSGEKSSLIQKGAVIHDRYEILDEIGSGGFGQVFSAFDRLLKKEVALKFLSPEVINSEKKFVRVKREINISQKITDKRIVKIFSLEQWEDKYYLVMELAKGRTLKDILAQNGRMKWGQIRGIYMEILKAVQTLHKNNIVHRDLKPSNIMINADGSVKLLDFGLSKEITDLEKTSSIGEIVGSPYYMSPEQVSMSDVDERSDIYQLGLILYRSLTGELPFPDNTNTFELLYQRVSEDPKKFSTLGIKVDKFLEFGILKALERKRENRFSSIEEMIAFFEDERYPFLGRFFARIKRHPHITVAIILFLTILGIFLFYLKKNSLEIKSFNFKGSILSASNSFGVNLFANDYKPYTILKPVIHRLGKDFFPLRGRFVRDNYLISDNNVIALFLIKKNLYPSIVRESINSDKYASKVCLIDKKGKTLYTETMHMTKTFNSKSEFSGWMNFQHIRKGDIDLDGNDELMFQTCHNMSMFPSQFVLLGKEKFNFIYNPGHFDMVRPLYRKDRYSFLVEGRNNPLCHMKFISEVNLKKNGKIVFFPTITEKNFKLKINYFYTVIPTSISIKRNSWKENGEIVIYDNRDNAEITILKNYIMKVKKGYKSRVFHDDAKNLSDVYNAIDKMYRKKIIEMDFKESHKIISDINFLSVENPYLLSVLNYYKGDLEICMGKYKSGEKSLKRSLKYYRYNSDTIQRRYEVEFLRGDRSIKDLNADNLIGKDLNFYGLSRAGIRMFVTYCNLQNGSFRKAEKVVKPIKSGAWILESIIHIFKGNYLKAYEMLKSKIAKSSIPFTLEESRLTFARAALLSYLYHNQGDSLDKDSLELCKFYFKDIADNSYLNGYFADISASFFLTGEEDREDLINYTKNKFNKLIEISKGNMTAKLWLFYDAFIYAKVMEKLGVKEETIRGYDLCIKANPHTDLAKRAKKVLAKIDF